MAPRLPGARTATAGLASRTASRSAASPARWSSATPSPGGGTPQLPRPGVDSAARRGALRPVDPQTREGPRMTGGLRAALPNAFPTPSLCVARQRPAPAGRLVVDADSRIGGGSAPNACVRHLPCRERLRAVSQYVNGLADTACREAVSAAKLPR